MTACGNDWEKHGDRCYLWGEEKMSWDDAEAFCRKKGGHLASVTSEEINAYVAQEKKQRNMVLWIGGSDKTVEGAWKWSDGSPWNYTKWSQGQPNNEDNEDCLQFYYRNEDSWSDRTCTNRENFVCSKALCSGGKSFSFVLYVLDQNTSHDPTLH